MQDGASTEWLNTFFYKTGEFYILLKLLQNIEKMPENFQKTLKQFIGFWEDKKTIMQEPGIQDEWIITGSLQQDVEDRHGVVGRRTWLYGKNTGQTALILDYVFGGVFQEHYGLVGACFEGEIVFYPGVLKQRAVVKSQSRAISEEKPQFISLYENLQRHATTLSAFPWLTQYPFLLSKMSIVSVEKKWFLVDEKMKMIPLKIAREKALKMLVITGNQPFDVFGEWAENIFFPMTVWSNERVFPLNNA